MPSSKEDRRLIESLLLSTSLLNKNGKCVKTKDVLRRAKNILLYFSASWCTAFECLLPQLKEIYEENIKYEMGLQIIYISLDTEKKKMIKYFKENHGDWFTIPFGDIAINNLRFRYGVTSIPYVVVIKRDGTVISTNAKEEIDKYGINVLIKWAN